MTSLVGLYLLDLLLNHWRKWHIAVARRVCTFHLHYIHHFMSALLGRTLPSVRLILASKQRQQAPARLRNVTQPAMTKKRKLEKARAFKGICSKKGEYFT